MNLVITPTSEALIQKLIELGHDTPEVIVEEALQYFHSQQLIDTTVGFPTLNEAEVIEESEQRWQNFQNNQTGISQIEMEKQFLDQK